MSAPVIAAMFILGFAVVGAACLGMYYTSRYQRASRQLHRRRFESGVSRQPVSFDFDVEMSAEALEERRRRYTDLPYRNVGEHPPVYCVDDMELPPPAYEPQLARIHKPTIQELSRLRICLETLKRQPPTVDTTAFDVAIRRASIDSLESWIKKLETIRQSSSTLQGTIGNTIRMVTSPEVTVQPSNTDMRRFRPGMRQRETGWIGVGQPREVRPRLDPITNTLVPMVRVVQEDDQDDTPLAELFRHSPTAHTL